MKKLKTTTNNGLSQEDINRIDETLERELHDEEYAYAKYAYIHGEDALNALLYEECDEQCI